MNDDFEQRLSNQPVGKIPGEWRAEILAAAYAARIIRQPPSVTRRFWLSALNHQLSALLWPHPKAWAGLAAVWAMILVLYLSTHEPVSSRASLMVEKTSPPSPEVIVELKKQQRMFAELMGTGESHDADRPKNATTKPRTQRAEILRA